MVWWGVAGMGVILFQPVDIRRDVPMSFAYGPLPEPTPDDELPLPSRHPRDLPRDNPANIEWRQRLSLGKLGKPHPPQRKKAVYQDQFDPRCQRWFTPTGANQGRCADCRADFARLKNRLPRRKSA